ncbi:MAG: sigma-70 family RNA polymerase sigma factor [Planctomycetota bacterium]
MQKAINQGLGVTHGAPRRRERRKTSSSNLKAAIVQTDKSPCSMPDETANERFLELLTENHYKVFGYLYALVCHREDAEDLMQQTVIKLWEHFDQYTPGTNFSAWACKIAKNCALNYFQSRHRKTIFSSSMMELLAQTQATIDDDIREARRVALRGCLGKLSDQDRDLITKCYSLDKTIRVIADELQRPAAGVYNSISRIRKALFNCIESTIAREGRPG